jgi:hypothetical protein
MRTKRGAALAAAVTLTVGLAVGACGGGGSHRATTAPTPTAVPNAAAESGPAAADLQPVDDFAAQSDAELSAADQGLSATEADPTQ